MTRKRMPHQIQAVKWAKNRSELPIFWECRLGKTLATIDITKNNNKNLVVCPSSVLYSWKQELDTEKLSYGTLVAGKNDLINTTMDLLSNDAKQYYLISYESLREMPALARIPWNTIILDESTKIKNPKASITKVLIKFFSSVPRKIILTGSPAPEGVMDYFAQMVFLYGSFMGISNWYQFRNKFYNQIGHQWIPLKNTTETIKKAVHKTAFVLTRTAAGLGKKKIYQIRTVPMSAKQKKAYVTAKTEWVGTYGEETKWAPVSFLWLSRIAGGWDTKGKECISNGKTNELLNLLQSELSGAPVVVWFRFNAELYHAQNHLRKAGISTVSITGANTGSDRSARLDKFRTGKRRVLLMQVAVGREGLDLSIASAAIYYSNSYSCFTRLQSEDRIIHPMKKGPLLFIDLVTEKTVDMGAVKVLQQKKRTSEMLMKTIVRGLR